MTTLNRAESKDSILATITTIFNQLANVTVITVVGDVNVSLTTSGGKIRADVSAAGDLRSYTTQINLIEGDIIATVPTDFETLSAIGALHTANVDKAVGVLPANVRAMMNTAAEIIKLLDNNPPPALPLNG